MFGRLISLLQENLVEVWGLHPEHFIVELLELLCAELWDIEFGPVANEQIQLLHTEVLRPEDQLLAKGLELGLQTEVLYEFSGGSNFSEVGNHL